MQTDETLRRWLTAERQATEAEAPGRAVAAAEQALRGLLLALPEARPRPGFAERVMAAWSREGYRAAWSREGYRAAWSREWYLGEASSRALGWPLRALAAACLLITGTALALLPSVAGLLGARISLADVVSGIASALTLGADYLVALISIGELFGALQNTLLAVVTSPPVTLAWLGSLVLAIVTLRWLVQLLSPQRSSGYVPAY